MKKLKLTKLEKYWIMYDVGNSAFTLLVSTILPIFFNYLTSKNNVADSDYMAYWGYATSIATLIVAILGPVLGSMADNKGFKKPLFMIFMLLGAAMCAALGFATHYLVFLIIYVIGKVGFSGSLIFYDAMLNDVTTEDRVDDVSSGGYAWGYIGSCVPFVLSLVLVLFYDKIGLSLEIAMAIAFIINAIWWVVMSLPLLKNYKQKYYIERQPKLVSSSFKRLFTTFKNVRKEKKIFLFLLAFFFYIDGVYTIIDMATSYGMALGLDSTGLLLALLITQIVAFPCAIIFGRLAGKFNSEKLIIVCIAAYFGIAIFGIFISTQFHFYLLAVLVGMFQGGIQALSRSYFSKIIPANCSGEYFGLFDICGKGAAFMGAAIVSVVSQLTHSANAGVAMIAVLFVIGGILFRLAAKTEPSSEDNAEKVLADKPAHISQPAISSQAQLD